MVASRNVGLFFRLFLFSYLSIVFFICQEASAITNQELKLVGCRSTVEPRNNPRDWQNLFTITRFRYIDVLFHIFYYYWGKKLVCFTENVLMKRFVISRFHFALRIA